MGRGGEGGGMVMEGGDESGGFFLIKFIFCTEFCLHYTYNTHHTIRTFLTSYSYIQYNINHTYTILHLLTSTNVTYKSGVGKRKDENVHWTHRNVWREKGEKNVI